MNLIRAHASRVDETGAELDELRVPILDVDAAGVRLHCQGKLVTPGDRLRIDFVLAGDAFSLIARVTLVHESASSSNQQIAAQFEALDAVTHARLVHAVIRGQLRRLGRGAA